jgi:hypothetical protein
MKTTSRFLIIARPCTFPTAPEQRSRTNDLASRIDFLIFPPDDSGIPFAKANLAVRCFAAVMVVAFAKVSEASGVAFLKWNDSARTG